LAIPKTLARVCVEYIKKGDGFRMKKGHAKQLLDIDLFEGGKKFHVKWGRL